MIEVTNRVKIYERGGKDATSDHTASPRVLIVKSHWNYQDRVVLTVDDGRESLTVLAKDLVAAIKNATNINRHG